VALDAQFDEQVMGQGPSEFLTWKSTVLSTLPAWN
jgi:hypothetical protein